MQSYETSGKGIYIFSLSTLVHLLESTEIKLMFSNFWQTYVFVGK